MACVVSAFSGISECMNEEMVNETKQQPTSKREEDTQQQNSNRGNLYFSVKSIGTSQLQTPLKPYSITYALNLSVRA